MTASGTGAFYQWGQSGDIPVPGDFNGDGVTDTAVFRPADAVWHVRYLPTGPEAFYQWGLTGDIPILQGPQ